MAYFTDEHRHPYFHTNNLWFDLQALARTLDERNAVLGLPMIKNVKTVDPSDSVIPGGGPDRERDGRGDRGLLRAPRPSGWGGSASCR